MPILQDAFAGGTDTQLVVMEWMMAHLLKDPEIMSNVRAELDRVVGRERKVSESDLPNLKYLDAVVKETFRLHPPVPLLVPRESTQACNVAGYVVPSGTRLFVNVYAIGRDARVWEDPESFLPERFVEGHERFLGRQVDVFGQCEELLPFGTGRRICPAASMGVLQVALFVGSLVQGFEWEVPEGVELDMTEGVGITTPMATPVRVVARPRLPRHLYL